MQIPRGCVPENIFLQKMGVKIPCLTPGKLLGGSNDPLTLSVPAPLAEEIND